MAHHGFLEDARFEHFEAVLERAVDAGEHAQLGLLLDAGGLDDTAVEVFGAEPV